jgi:hypothetical protein
MVDRRRTAVGQAFEVGGGRDCQRLRERINEYGRQSADRGQQDRSQTAVGQAFEDGGGATVNE